MSADHLWEVNTDRTTGAFLTPPRKIVSLLAEEGETHVSGMTATADGKQAMVQRV
jgi:hypothetical protein